MNWRKSGTLGDESTKVCLGVLLPLSALAEGIVDWGLLPERFRKGHGRTDKQIYGFWRASMDEVVRTVRRRQDKSKFSWFYHVPER